MPFIIAIVLLVASFVIMALTTHKPPDAKPAYITDFQFPQTNDGTPQSVIFGDTWSPDYQILWYGNLKSTAIRPTAGKK